jgi:hypothetical protein
VRVARAELDGVRPDDVGVLERARGAEDVAQGERGVNLRRLRCSAFRPIARDDAVKDRQLSPRQREASRRSTSGKEAVSTLARSARMLSGLWITVPSGTPTARQRYAGVMAARVVLTFRELAEAFEDAPPPTEDDVSITNDGRRLDTFEKAKAYLDELNASLAAERGAGKG